MPQQTYSRAPSPAGLDADIAAILIRLLRDAERGIGRDEVAAIDCLNRASALLESERSRAVYRSTLRRFHEPRPTFAPWQTQRVTTFVTENVANPIGLADLARLVRMPATQFVRAFQGTFGIEVHEYVALRRLNLACISMLTTDQTLGQIAEACGLYDEIRLAAAFQDSFGERPEAWRHARRGFAEHGGHCPRDLRHGRDS